LRGIGLHPAGGGWEKGSECPPFQFRGKAFSGIETRRVETTSQGKGNMHSYFVAVDMPRRRIAAASAREWGPEAT